MLPKSHRLTKQDIERLYKKGQNIRQDFILARILANRTDHCRFSVIISKKVWPLAFARNRAKRIIYQWIGDHENLFKERNLDLSLQIKSQFDEAKIDFVLTQLFERIK